MKLHNIEKITIYSSAEAADYGFLYIRAKETTYKVDGKVELHHVEKIQNKEKEYTDGWNIHLHIHFRKPVTIDLGEPRDTFEPPENKKFPEKFVVR